MGFLSIKNVCSETLGCKRVARIQGSSQMVLENDELTTEKPIEVEFGLIVLEMCRKWNGSIKSQRSSLMYL